MAEIPFAEKYADKSYVDPGDNVDPKVKKDIYSEDARRWFQRKMEYIYSSYLRDDAYIPYSSTRDIRLNRLYAQGKQPNTKYMERLTIADPKTGERKGWMNMSWDILPILTKFRSIVLGRFDEIDYSTRAHAIDDVSSSMKEDIKWTKLVETKYAEEMAAFKQALGIQDEEQQLPFVPKTIEEMDMLASMGFFRLAYEVVMDKLLIATAQKCNWQEIKRRVFEDIVDIGWLSVKDYTDPVNGKPMVRYVDPEYFIIRQTRQNDFSDVTEAGEIVWMSIGELRAFGLNDDELYAAANAYAGVYGNPFISQLPGANLDRNRFDYLKVAVLDAEFQSLDTSFYESRTLPNGRTVEFPLDFGEKPSSKKNKFGSRQHPKLYRCKWIIGTNVLFDYGMQYNQTYNQENKPRSSFSCYRVSERSMISQCITSADDVQLAVLKLRNALAESVPAGIQIELGSIKEITLGGGQKLEPFEVLKIYRDRGDLLFRYALAQNGQPIQGGIPPITELKGGIGPYLQELISILDWNINMIREITGLNEMTDASTPASSTLVGVAQIAEQGTSNVLRPMLSGYKSVKQRTFMNICQRWQIAGKYYPQSMPFVKDKAGAIEMLKVASELYEPVYDVYVDMPIQGQDLQSLENACLQSMTAAKTGSIGITMADYVYIKELMSVNNMRAAWVYLAYRENQMKAQQDATMAANAEANNRAAQEQEALKAQLKAQEIAFEENEKRKTLILESYLKMNTERVKAGAPIPPEVEMLAMQLMQPAPPQGQEQEMSPEEEQAMMEEEAAAQQGQQMQ